MSYSIPGYSSPILLVDGKEHAWNAEPVFVVMGARPSLRRTFKLWHRLMRGAGGRLLRSKRLRKKAGLG